MTMGYTWLIAVCVCVCVCAHAFVHVHMWRSEVNVSVFLSDSIFFFDSEPGAH